MMMSAHYPEPKRVSHTNRHGDTFYIRMRKTSRGVRYSMVKTPHETIFDLPEGFEILEDVNGRVSIVRTRRSPIVDTEKEMVRAALRQLCAPCYRVDVRGKYITIYASASDHGAFTQSIDAEFADGFAAALEEMFARRYGQELADLFRSHRIARDGGRQERQYYPLLRFALVDARSRKFSVQRIYFTGDCDWLHLEDLALSAAVMKYVPHLGKNSFFDLL